MSTCTVKELDISTNCLTPHEAEALSDMMTCLEKIYIVSNELGDSGAKALSRGIENTKTLKELHISKNTIATLDHQE